MKAHSALAVDGLIVKEESLAKSGVYLQDIGIKVNTVHNSEDAYDVSPGKVSDHGPYYIHIPV